MKKLIVLLFTLVLSSPSLFSQADFAIDSEAITQEIYQHVDDNTPGLAVGIVKDGQIIYEKYVGLANLDYGIAVDENTRFNIASNAKQFTAICILKLSEEGKLNLEDDIRQYVPDLYQERSEEITLLDLIVHTSGLRDYCELYALKGKTWWKQFIDNDDVLELLQDQKDFNFAPGTDFLYSNSNYILLTEVVKKVTAQEFHEYAKTFFEELDMPNCSFRTHYAEITPNKARPYGNWGTWREEPVITEVHGDGALFTTLPAQLQWERIVQMNDGSYLPQALITKSQSPIDGVFDPSYGYGLMMNEYQGVAYTYHDGATGAYNANLLRFPEQSLSLVVMSNSRNVNANYISWRIALTLLDFDQAKSGPHPNGPERIEKLKRWEDITGVYKSEGGSVIRIVERDGSLYRQLYQRDDDRLIPEKGGLFEYENIKGLKINFTNIGEEDQQFTLYASTQEPSTYFKQADPQLNTAKSEINGRYYNDETDTEIILEYIDGTTYALTKNGRKRDAFLILNDYIRMMSSYEFMIIRDGENNVVGINANNDRIKNVIFDKL